MYWIGLLVVIVLAGWIFAGNGGLMVVLDIPSILLLLGLVLSLLAASGLMKDFLRVFRVVKGKTSVFTRTELEKSLLAVRLTMKLLLGSGVFGTMTGAIFIFAQVSEIFSMPKALSVSGIILLYAILLWLILLPLQSHLESRLLEPDDS